MTRAHAHVAPFNTNHDAAKSYEKSPKDHEGTSLQRASLPRLLCPSRSARISLLINSILSMATTRPIIHPTTNARSAARCRHNPHGICYVASCTCKARPTRTRMLMLKARMGERIDLRRTYSAAKRSTREGMEG